MTQESHQWSAATIFYILSSAVLVTYILWLGANILRPIVIAGLFWFALVSIARFLQGIGPLFVGKIFVSHLASWVILILASWLLTSTISSAVLEFSSSLTSDDGQQLAKLAGNFTLWTEQQTASLTGLFTGEQPAPTQAQRDLAAQVELWVSNWFKIATDTLLAQLPQAAGSLLSATQSSLILISTVLIYLLFYYSESSSFPKKLTALNREEEDHHRWSALIGLIVSRLASYIRIKTLTSALTGSLGYLLMSWLDVSFALFFALLLFLLNYIPVVGSFLSSLLPIVLFLIDPDFSVTNWLILIVGLLSIQQSIGSVLEPRLLANSFNISSILVMASLLFWGAIWGVFGMLISAPITAAGVILLANFQGSRQLAILLSADGNIDDLRPQS